MGRSHPKEFSDPRPAIYRQKKLVTDIFRSEHEDFKHLFGIEWCVTLFLSSVQFLFPTLYIRHFLGKTLHSRKVFIELWAIGKPLFFLILLFQSDFGILTFCLTSYLLADLYLYLLGLVFLNDFYSGGISKTRNLLLLQLNFLESNLGFAILYLSRNCLEASKGQIIANIDAVYFSFVTSATVGYGDIVSNCRWLTVLQIMTSFLFVSVILGTFINRKESEFQKKKTFVDV